MESKRKGKEIEAFGSGARSNPQHAIMGSNSRTPSKGIDINL
jgi:hypothetical protein